MAKIPHNTKAIKNARHFFILFSFGPPNYMSVDSHVHKRTYTRTLRIHCPTSPCLASKPGAVGAESAMAPPTFFPSAFKQKPVWALCM